MRAGLRFGIAAYAAALALAPTPALAQDTAAPATNTPAASTPPETIGPRELRDFTINGTVTRPAPVAPPRVAPPRTTTPPATTTTAPPPESTAARDRPAPAPDRERPSPARSAATSLAPSDALPDAATDTSPTLAPEPGFEPVAPPATDSGDQPSNYVPWLLALLLLAGGAGFYAWRQRAQPRYATAGADAFVAPEPAPRLQPRAPTPRPATAAPGIVSTRIRPWLEIEFSPGRCVVQEDKATIQFDVAVFNSGSAPARDVLIEASMFNAGPAQDQEISAFFQHPVAKGDRIPAIPPLKRVALKSAVSLTLEQMRQFEVAGKRIFVPLIGFNALYRWSGGDGQTSASYLVGRDTKGDKMAPLRLDLGPRIFRGLGARQHNLGVRT
jgi:hypothetical protein